jgi:hypothetical protein
MLHEGNAHLERLGKSLDEGTKRDKATPRGAHHHEIVPDRGDVRRHVTFR